MGADKFDASATPTVKGKVLEIRDVDSYSYIRLQTTKGEVWAAVMRAPIKKGASGLIRNISEMRDFHSKALNKTFPVILFGSLAGSGTAAMSVNVMADHGMSAGLRRQNPMSPKPPRPGATTHIRLPRS